MLPLVFPVFPLVAGRGPAAPPLLGGCPDIAVV